MRTSLLPLVVLALALPAVPAAAQFDFGTVGLGEVPTVCVFLCFSQQQGSGDCDASGNVNSIDVGAPFFVRGIRKADASEPDVCAGGGVTTPLSLPATLDAGEVLVFDVDLVATQLGSQTSALEINGSPVTSLQATVVPANNCLPSTDALCLQDDRFTVRTRWRTMFGGTGKAPIVPGLSSDDSGLFYFFDDDNWEILLKVLNGCGVNDRFWVFAAATTNVEYTITVTDTQTQQAKSYFNPMGPAAQPIQDTSAFATCP